MKIDKNKNITITEARLLTKEEAEELPKRLKLYGSWWWTSTAITNSYIYVWLINGCFGWFNYDGVDGEYTVRPALMFESEDLKIGDKFQFGGKEFEVIKEGLAFCTSHIGKSAFRTNWRAKDANQYEVSDIKKYIDKWFEEAIK